jgi:hypothetical protein
VMRNFVFILVQGFMVSAVLMDICSLTSRSRMA